ncbi:Uncharacterised protein [Mycolicibacterium vanbaalenii]|uniref:Uncharacterized protein n=1 Tax=Mycolicibacterium vanbaalenii TaxID=110539 RepID=A0A5S9NLT8_MYCVN|nr:hypothetical protein [Mycolicibacterium vanbaalenii]CAA0091657.1 Uncharacterised protein [Mycolicibacterium vanbaalenii]
MTTVKRALSTSGMLCLGVLAATGIYLACVLVTFMLGGMFYSITLGAMVAPVVAFVIFAYRWTRRRATTAWPLMTAMVVTQVVIAAAAFLDSPSTATMWFH